MNLEGYVQEEGWNVYFQNGEVESFFGKTYTIKYDKAKSDFSSLGEVYPWEQTILVREPTDSFLESVSSKEEVMACTLMHQLGHADTYYVSGLIQTAILTVAVQRAVRQKSLEPLGIGALVMATYKLIGEDVLAEINSSLFYGSPFMKAVYLNLPDVVGMGERIIENVF